MLFVREHTSYCGSLPKLKLYCEEQVRKVLVATLLLLNMYGTYC